MDSSYGQRYLFRQWCLRGFVGRFLGALSALILALVPAAAGAAPFQIVAFGDSLSAGYQLPQSNAFPVRLEAALKAKGHDVAVINAGVSGDTASDGVERMDWSVPDGTQLVILELGANDMLRGLDPDLTRTALTKILERMQARNIKVLVCGMLAAPNLGAEYRGRFETIYPELAKQFNVPLYPFFLEGMARDPALTLSDGMHPNAAGVDTVVAHILPAVEKLIPQK